MRENITIAETIRRFLESQDLIGEDHVVQIVVNTKCKEAHYVGSVPLNGWTERDYILAQLQLEPYMAKIGGPDKVRERLLRIYQDNAYDNSPMEARETVFDFFRDGGLGVIDMTDEEVMASFLMELHNTVGAYNEPGETIRFSDEELAEYFECEEEGEGEAGEDG